MSKNKTIFIQYYLRYKNGFKLNDLLENVEYLDKNALLDKIKLEIVELRMSIPKSKIQINKIKLHINKY